MSVARYIVAGCRPWTRTVFDDVISRYPGDWHYVSDPSELTVTALEALAPRYVFFLHWIWKVPTSVTTRYECVCFHMTDVPYGRGGSPLQNLILAGHRTTKLSALRMTDELDGGPVYLKEDLSLTGRAQDVYERASTLAAQMVGRMIAAAPTPQPQTGTPVIFRRRRPEESRLPPAMTPQQLFDFIRMLDADGYPHAFLEHDGFRFEFRSASLEVTEDGGPFVTARVVIAPVGTSR